MQSLYGIRFLPIARVDGILLGLDARWFGIRGGFQILLLGLMTIAIAPGDMTSGALWTRCLAGLSTVAAVLLTSVGHELGHVVASRLAGLSVQAVVLAPQGGVTIHSGSEVRGVNVLTALAGPLANAMIGGVCVLVMIGLGPDRGVCLFMVELAALQWLTAIVNLVPCGPMDGRRMLAAYQAREARRATGQANA